MKLKVAQGAVALMAALAVSASAQVHVEALDAPDGPVGAQQTFGIGVLQSITGVLNRPGGDHVDSYSLVITDPSQFLASTKIFFGGSATTQAGTNADTRLWLWDTAGNLLLSNDDVNSAGLGTTDNLASLISDPSTFPTFSGGEIVNATAAGVSLTAGNYILSISEFSNDPDDAAGVDLANLGADFDALHGLNPAAVGGFDHWENAADSTVITYDITVQGAEFKVPEPASLGLLALGAIFGLRRRSA